jgi:hypothetical protein
MVEDTWAITDVGGDLWNQCKKLRELILGDRIPTFADGDGKRMRDNNEALSAPGDWYSYHRRIKKKPGNNCLHSPELSLRPLGS